MIRSVFLFFKDEKFDQNVGAHDFPSSDKFLAILDGFDRLFEKYSNRALIF